MFAQIENEAGGCVEEIDLKCSKLKEIDLISSELISIEDSIAITTILRDRAERMKKT